MNRCPLPFINNNIALFTYELWTYIQRIRSGYTPYLVVHTCSIQEEIVVSDVFTHVGNTEYGVGARRHLGRRLQTAP